jgi:uncharacterized protein YeaC (DUF1315 family)
MSKKCIHCRAVKKSSEADCKECRKAAREKRREALKDAITTLEQKLEQSISENENLQERMEALEKKVKGLKIADHNTCQEEIGKLQEDVALTQDVYTRAVEAVINYLDVKSKPEASVSSDDDSNKSTDHKQENNASIVPSALDETIILRTPALKSAQVSRSALYEKYAYKPKA